MGKKEVLHYLKQNRGQIISGEKIGQALDVSRAAVHKSIKQLIEEDAPIAIHKNMGYAYMDMDPLVVEDIEKHLQTKAFGREILLQQAVDSTNLVVKDHKDKAEGFLAIAEEQKAGKGRFGRAFQSTKEAGIYMSLLLKPKEELSLLPFLTILSPLAVAKAIYKVTGTKVDIKWPNDVIIKGKKICGISTEMVIDGERGMAEYVVVGIGINCKKQSFHQDLVNKAITLEEITDNKIQRNLLVAEVLNHLEKLYDNYSNHREEIVAEYREYIPFLGEEITVLQGDRQEAVVAKEIDKYGRLIILKKDGTLESLLGGEVSIRGVYGYEGK